MRIRIYGMSNNTHAGLGWSKKVESNTSAEKVVASVRHHQFDQLL